MIRSPAVSTAAAVAAIATATAATAVATAAATATGALTGGGFIYVLRTLPSQRLWMPRYDRTRVEWPHRLTKPLLIFVEFLNFR